MMWARALFFREGARSVTRIFVAPRAALMWVGHYVGLHGCATVVLVALRADVMWGRALFFREGARSVTR